MAAAAALSTERDDQAAAAAAVDPNENGIPSGSCFESLAGSLESTLASWRSAFLFSDADASSSSVVASAEVHGERAEEATAAANGGENAGSNIGGGSGRMHIGGGDETKAGDRRRYLSPSAYRERLSTFKASTYFAKPSAMSPLVCARFGWTNAANDLLVCSHPRCRAAVCVAIPPLLSAKAVDDLCKTYRRMLATSHFAGFPRPTSLEATSRHAPDGVCPFRDDAERWLLPPPTAGGSEGADGGTAKTTVASADFVVPPYLLTASEEFLIFEDNSAGGCVTKHSVRKKAEELGRFLRSCVPGHQSSGGDGEELEFCIVVPREVFDWWQGQNLSSVGEDNIKLTYESLALSIRHALPLDEDADEADENDTTEVSSRITKESAILAAFGWSVLEDEVRVENGCFVRCECCLACTNLPKRNVRKVIDCIEGKVEKTLVDEKGSFCGSNAQEKGAAARVNVECKDFMPKPTSLDEQDTKRGKKRRCSSPIGASPSERNYYEILVDSSSSGDSESEEDMDGVACPPQQKKRRIGSPTSREASIEKLKDNPPGLNLVKSHRSFCPFACGFSMESSSSVPGWEIVLGNLLKQEVVGNAVAEDTTEHSFTSVCSILRSSIFR